MIMNPNDGQLVDRHGRRAYSSPVAPLRDRGRRRTWAPRRSGGGIKAMREVALALEEKSTTWKGM